jgi:putative nucleotidyltransferase with HDIG domain
MEPRRRILFVDDDEAVGKSFVRSLRDEPLDIEVASNGEAAMTLAQTHKYAVIAVDFHMPRIDGLRLVDKLISHQPDATYILVSGQIDIDKAIEAVNHHKISFVIRKPWETDELVAMFRRSLDIYRQRLQAHAAHQHLVESTWAWEEERRNLKAAADAGGTRLAAALMQALVVRGHETPAHCRRVAGYSLAMGRQLGLSPHDLDVLERGALLHDIGKVAIPESIFTKHGELTAEEWKIVRTHPDAGANMLEGMGVLLAAQPVVREHHERFDGSGYPRGISGERICLGARIFAVADTLDAISSSRAYHSTRSFEAAAEEIIKHSGTAFDPAIVEVFRRIPLKTWADINAANSDAK